MSSTPALGLQLGATRSESSHLTILDRVRGTVRSQAKAEAWDRRHASLKGRIDWSVRALHRESRSVMRLTSQTLRLSPQQIVEDMTAPSAFSRALKDVSVVAHVASPVNYSLQDKWNDVLNPAIHGVLRLLEDSAKESSVERVVFTSSAATIIGTHCVPGVGKTYK